MNGVEREELIRSNKSLRVNDYLYLGSVAHIDFNASIL